MGRRRLRRHDSAIYHWNRATFRFVYSDVCITELSQLKVRKAKRISKTEIATILSLLTNGTRVISVIC